MTHPTVPPTAGLIRVTAEPPAPPGHVLIIADGYPALCITRTDAEELAGTLLLTALMMPDAE